MKTYKRSIYWFNTVYACGAVAVDQDGKVYPFDTAPIFRWMAGKSFVEMKNNLKRNNKVLNCKKIDVEIDPF